MVYLSKKIVCLANSEKCRGRCIAGKELSSSGEIGKWIRPVSDRTDQEISNSDRKYELGGYAELLDIIDVPIIRYSGSGFQSENYLINDEYYWQKAGKIEAVELDNYCDSNTEILGHINDSGSYGINDRIPEEIVATLTKSLCFVRVDSISINVKEEGGNFGNPRKKVRAQFKINKTTFCIAVTDPRIKSKFKLKEDGYLQHFNNKMFMCLSLGLPYNGHRYRLVTSIINLL